MWKFLSLFTLFIVFLEKTFAYGDIYEMPALNDGYIEYSYTTSDEPGPSVANQARISTRAQFFQINARNPNNRVPLMKMNVNHGYRVILDLSKGASEGIAQTFLVSANIDLPFELDATQNDLGNLMREYGTEIRCHDRLNDNIKIHKVNGKFVADICKSSGISEPRLSELRPQQLFFWLSDAERGYISEWHVRYSGEGIGRRLDFDGTSGAHGDLAPVQTVEYSQEKLDQEPTISRECAICLEEMTRGGSRVEQCNRHLFHTDCLKSWLDNRPSSKTGACPICRR